MGQADTLAAKLADAAVAMTLPVSDDAVVATVLISHEDLRRAYAVVSAQMSRSPKFVQFARGQARLLALFGGVPLVAGVGFLLTRPVGGIAIVALVSAAALFWTAWTMWRRPSMAVAVARAEARMKKHQFPDCWYEQTTLAFDRAGCRGFSAHSASFIGWELVASVDVDDQAVRVNGRSGSVQILPVRAFESVDAMRAAGARLIAWLDESGYGDANRLRKYLREKPTACPFCKKSLDAERLQCSGCGEPVTRYLVPEVGFEPTAHPPTVPGRVEV